jgi:hypothetical protein
LPVRKCHPKFLELSPGHLGGKQARSIRDSNNQETHLKCIINLDSERVDANQTKCDLLSVRVGDIVHISDSEDSSLVGCIALAVSGSAEPHLNIITLDILSISQARVRELVLTKQDICLFESVCKRVHFQITNQKLSPFVQVNHIDEGLRMPEEWLQKYLLGGISASLRISFNHIFPLPASMVDFSIDL